MKYRKECAVITKNKHTINLVIPKEYEPALFTLKKEIYWKTPQSAMFRELLSIGIRSKMAELERRDKHAHEHEANDDRHP